MKPGQSCLFIGGHADGEWRNVEMLHHDERGYELPESWALASAPDECPMVSAKMDSVTLTYRTRRWMRREIRYANSPSRYIYVEDGMTDLDILDHLLRNYSPARLRR